LKINSVPFNDLSRIHIPLLSAFHNKFEEIARNSHFVLGSEVSDFEEELAVLEGCKFAIGVNNGTTAIELALRAAGVKSGDEVITTSFTFVATIHAIEQTGATPVLVDILPNSPLINPDLIKSQITQRTKALVVVSLHGMVDHISQYLEIAKNHNLILILDGAQSHLGRYQGKPLTDYFDLVTLSFYPGKNLGALGEGGAVLTNNSNYSTSIKQSRDWGAEAKYEHKYWGGNYRLEALQASLLSVKIASLKKWTLERKEIAEYFKSELPNELLPAQISMDGDHVYHVFTIQVPHREALARTLTDKNIGWGIHYPNAVHQNPYYSRLAPAEYSLTNSEEFSARTLSLPIFPGMLEEEIKFVCSAIITSPLN
jgi:dTDP-4-amino-4,6-dideoxygalactose transaminase